MRDYIDHMPREINGKGQIKPRLPGIKGTRCSEIVDRISTRLGPVVKRSETAEYYEQEHVVKNSVEIETR